MKKQKVAINYLYNVSFQILTLLTPIITAPYLTRTLGATNLGIYNYTYSIVYWFILFGIMGIGIYGNKEIAKVSNDRKKLSQKFSEIFCLQLFNMITSLTIFYLVFSFFNFKYKTVFLIQGLLILASVFDISWLYIGLENFKKTSIRNFIVKIILVFGIFVIVKNESSLYIYTIFLSVMNIISQLILWIGLKKILDFRFVKFKKIFPHIKSNIILFIPTIATSLYSVFDQTMIGLLYNDVKEVGFYSQAHKLVNMLLFLVTTISTVMLPRAVKMKTSGEEKKLSEVTSFTLKIALFLSIPIAIGFASVSPFFIPWFLGEEFIKVGYIIPLLSPIMIFISITNVLGIQYLIVHDEIKKYTVSVTMGCVCNLVLNIFLIGKFGAYGASVASIITELVVLIIQYNFVKGKFDFNGIMKSIIKYLFFSLIMGIIVLLIGINLKANIITNIIQIVIGVVIYFALNILSKDDVFKFFLVKLKSILKLK